MMNRSCVDRRKLKIFVHPRQKHSRQYRHYALPWCPDSQTQIDACMRSSDGDRCWSTHNRAACSYPPSCALVRVMCAVISGIEPVRNKKTHILFPIFSAMRASNTSETQTLVHKSPPPGSALSPSRRGRSGGPPAPAEVSVSRAAAASLACLALKSALFSAIVRVDTGFSSSSGRADKCGLWKPLERLPDELCDAWADPYEARALKAVVLLLLLLQVQMLLPCDLWPAPLVSNVRKS